MLRKVSDDFYKNQFEDKDNITSYNKSSKDVKLFMIDKSMITLPNLIDSLAEGTTLFSFDILPFQSKTAAIMRNQYNLSWHQGDGYYTSLQIALHKVSLRNQGKEYVCLKRNYNEECPICNFVDEMYQSHGKEEAHNIGYHNLFPKFQTLYIVSRPDEDPRQLYILRQSTNGFQKKIVEKMKLLAQKHKEIGYVPYITMYVEDDCLVDKGYSIECSITDKTFNKGKYKDIELIDFDKSARTENPLTLEFLDRVPDLGAAIIKPDITELERAVAELQQYYAGVAVGTVVGSTNNLQHTEDDFESAGTEETDIPNSFEVPAEKAAKVNKTEKVNKAAADIAPISTECPREASDGYSVGISYEACRKAGNVAACTIKRSCYENRSK